MKQLLLALCLVLVSGCATQPMGRCFVDTKPQGKTDVIQKREFAECTFASQTFQQKSACMYLKGYTLDRCKDVESTFYFDK